MCVCSWCSFVTVTRNTQGDTKPRTLYLFISFAKTSVSCHLFQSQSNGWRERVMSFSTHLLMNDEASGSSKIRQSMDYVQSDLGANKNAPLQSLTERTLMRERFSESVLLIKFLIQMRSGTFQKRKPFICAGTAELVWRASLWCSYREKLDEIQCIMALIWSQWGAGLSTVNYWPHRPYIARVFRHSPSMINGTIIILQYVRLTVKTADRFKREESLGLRWRSCQ